MLILRRVAWIVCALVMLLAGGSLWAAFPERPVRFIVPFAPGGGTDIVGRTLGQKLGEYWAMPVITDNRPGAGSTLGTALAVRAEPDGYTMVLNSISLAFNVSLFKSLPFDVRRDLAPVTQVAIQPNLVVINPRLPAKSVAEFLALAKSKPGALRYASGGNGSGPHLATEMLQLMAHIKMVHIPYKGTGPALTDLLAGNVDVMISVAAAALPHVKSGRLRALAVTGDERLSVAPDVPTLSAAGVPGYGFKTWYGVQVPRKTDTRVIALINAALLKALASADVQARFSALGLEARGGSPAEFATLIDAEIKKWAKVVQDSGARIQ